MQNIDSYHIPEGKISEFTPYRDRIKEEIKEFTEEEAKQ